MNNALRPFLFDFREPDGNIKDILQRDLVDFGTQQEELKKKRH